MAVISRGKVITRLVPAGDEGEDLTGRVLRMAEKGLVILLVMGQSGVSRKRKRVKGSYSAEAVIEERR